MISVALLALVPIQSSQVLELLLRDGEPVPGFSAASEIREFYTPRRGLNGGWTCQLRAFDPSMGGSTEWVLVGQRPGQLDGPVELLRRPMVLQGLTQDDVIGGSMANGQIAYADSQFIPQRVWIDDQKIVGAGDPVGGMAGWTWRYFRQVELTTTGELIINGYAADSNGVDRDLLWRWPSQQVLLAEGQSLPGFGTVSALESGVSVSPDGTHWSQVVRRGAGLSCGVVMDGQILEAAPGRPLMDGSAVTPDIAGVYGPSLWELFQFPASVNDRGDWAVEGWIRTLSGSQERLIARNGRAFRNGDPFVSLIGMDARGSVLTERGSEVLIEDYPALTTPVQLDLDGDGLTDPGAGICSLGFFAISRPGQDAALFFKTRISTTGTCAFADEGLLRGRPTRWDLPVCEGVPNSTGTPGQLVVAGGSRVQENDVSLQFFGLPENAPCYALLSRSAGFAANPGGSQGNLCLGGGIGRMVMSLFVAGAEGRGEVAVDLTAMREPNGYVAAMPGERWFFQAWYRDAVSGVATSNFTSASAVVLD